jgi:hypothetical protein
VPIFFAPLRYFVALNLVVALLYVWVDLLLRTKVNQARV